MPLTPDPTFYPSPRSAAEAPREELAYVVTLKRAGTGAAAEGATGEAKPDALTVVDLKEGSSTYGQVVGRLDMPNVGDELHHFGWNACSSALCPWAPQPHVERRYLLVPGLKASRIHGPDVKGDAPSAEISKTIQPDPPPTARRTWPPQRSPAPSSRPSSTPSPATPGRTRSTAGPTGSTSPRSAR